jgi:hypothetical protein
MRIAGGQRVGHRRPRGTLPAAVLMLVYRGAHKTKTYVAPRLLHQRPVHAVHLVVEAARVAQVVAGAVAAPQRRRHGAAVDALAPVREGEVAVRHYGEVGHRCTTSHTHNMVTFERGNSFCQLKSRKNKAFAVLKAFFQNDML